MVTSRFVQRLRPSEQPALRMRYVPEEHGFRYFLIPKLIYYDN